MKTDLPILFAVASGGALGAVARFVVGRAAVHYLGPAYPYGTMAANIAGCFAMGFLFFWLAARGGVAVKAFLLVGMLGAFTTFSSFALDAALLFRDRTISVAAGYVVLSLTLSLAGFGLGAFFGKSL